MHILLIGSGGREHALAWKISKSQLVRRLTCAPGNPGMETLGTCVTIDDPVRFALDEKVDLVVVGPEQPLAEGLADRLNEAGIPCFGPGQAGAKLESSKAFTKEICEDAGVPTARWGHFNDPVIAKAFLGGFAAPYVIKADGLAAGKGVIIAEDRAKAEAAVDKLMELSGSVVIEEFLEGFEVSVFALTDGESVLPFGSASDYKRAYDGDNGPNTGGMGCLSPHPRFTKQLEEMAYSRIILPTLGALARKGIRYRGVLYAGLMITGEGPKLIEYNCRFGDPECQILMRRLRSDIVPALWGAATDRLGGVGLDWREEAGVLLTYATKGYPGSYEKGSAIKGLEDAEACEGAEIFHAGTSRGEDGVLRAAGGRVLSVTALALSIAEARDRAYEAAEAIRWPAGFHRTDIARGF